MKKSVLRNIIYILYLLIPIITLQSCKDDIPYEEIVNCVEYRITCDTPEAQMCVVFPHEKYYVKKELTNKVNSKAKIAIIDVTCDDPKALLQIELKVNGKLVEKEFGNRHVKLVKRIK